MSRHYSVDCCLCRVKKKRRTVYLTVILACHLHGAIFVLFSWPTLILLRPNRKQKQLSIGASHVTVYRRVAQTLVITFLPVTPPRSTADSAIGEGGRVEADWHSEKETGGGLSSNGALRNLHSVQGRPALLIAFGVWCVVWPVYWYVFSWLFVCV